MRIWIKSGKHIQITGLDKGTIVAQSNSGICLWPEATETLTAATVNPAIVQGPINDGQNPRSRLFHPGDTQDVGSPRRAKRNACGDRHGVADIGNFFAFCNTDGRDHHVTESMKVFRLNSMNPPGQN